MQCVECFTFLVEDISLVIDFVRCVVLKVIQCVSINNMHANAITQVKSVLMIECADRVAVSVDFTRVEILRAFALFAFW